MELASRREEQRGLTEVASSSLPDLDDGRPAVSGGDDEAGRDGHRKREVELVRRRHVADERLLRGLGGRDDTTLRPQRRLRAPSMRSTPSAPPPEARVGRCTLRD